MQKKIKKIWELNLKLILKFSKFKHVETQVKWKILLLNKDLAHILLKVNRKLYK